MKEKRNTKNKIIKIVALLGLFLLVFGVSFALFSVVLNGTKRNKITTANFGLRLTDTNGFEEEEGYGINLENALPMTQEEGLQTEPYQFVVTNTGSIPASYTLKLKEEKTNTLQKDYIRYNLIRQDYLKEYQKGSFAQGYFSTEKAWDDTGLEIIDASPKLIEVEDNQLDKTTLLPGESIEYTLNLWLDHEATTEQAANKTFEGKIEIEGVQATKYTTGKAGDKIDYTLYNDGTLILTGEGEMNGLVIDENGDIREVNNNVSPTFDIIYQYLKNNGINILSFNNGDLFDCYFSLSMYVYKTSIGLSLNLTEYFGEETETVIDLVEKLPKINRIVVGEGITKISPYFAYVFQEMISLPTTLEKIDPESIWYSTYINIPNTVKWIASSGMVSGIINIDNSEEYANAYFGKNWYEEVKIINYLR